VGRLRLELDIDADVYPELHATLTSLVSDASRGERLRQLAAAGLVWEKLRIRGQAALHGVAPDTHPVAALPAAVPAPAPAPRAARSGGSSRAPAAARGPAPAPLPIAPPRPAPPGFIDLALDAAPEPPPAPLTPLPSAPAAPAVPAPAVAQHWPPVLMDVVEPEDFATAIPVPKSDDRPSRPMPLAPPQLPSQQPPQRASQPAPQVVSQPLAVRVVDEVHDIAPPDPPIEHRSSTRSRLLRMKEKGLFKNG
jgi:hypothetical protein